MLYASAPRAQVRHLHLSASCFLEKRCTWWSALLVCMHPLRRTESSNSCLRSWRSGHESVLRALSLVPHSSSPLLASCVIQKALNTSSAQLKKQHCCRILILTDYMASGWYTKGLWMGGKWSTWWYRFIWSAIWVSLLSGFLGDWALLWLTRLDVHI